MSKPTPEPEIIDLTMSSPSPIPPEPLGHASRPVQDEPPSQETRRKRKRRLKKSTTSSTPTVTSSSSHRNSPERQPGPPTRDSKRQRPNQSENEELETTNRIRGNTNSGEEDNSDLFFVDLTPAVIPAARQIHTETSTEKTDSGRLLVPSHVTVLGSTPVQIISQPLSDSEDEDFIDYLDYDDNKPMHRYYDDTPNESTVISRTVCKNCGAEGQHKTSACQVMICLTCGARDEHSTRSCPISKVCFTCGMKGHINASCPNRRSARSLMAVRDNECDRCSSSRHKTNECPMLWRLYEYFTGDEQTFTLNLRHSKKDLQLGQGGEGYVADDEWCYNCGGYGHWGDDCHDIDRDHYPEEFSAFSNYNVMNGPFYDPEKELKASTMRSRPRIWDQPENISGWGKDAPVNVGRQGRMKSKAALARQEQQVEDDADDWFGRTTQRSATSSLPPKSSKKLSFSRSLAEAKSLNSSARRPPDLLSRLGERQYDTNTHRTEKANYHQSSRDPNSDRHRRDQRSSSDRYSARHRNSESGPRYKGGYTR